MSYGTMSKHQALQQPLPWRDLIEALPSNARLNISSTNPLSAAERHRKRQQCAGYSLAVYYPPADDAGFQVYLSRREIEILLALMPGEWVPTAALKGTAETRRPLATLREFGMIIATCHRQGEGDCYRLLGRIDLEPLPPVVAAAVQVIDRLPDRTTAARMERQRATAAFAKRLALIEKRSVYLSSSRPPQQLPLPETAA
jgi:hypothetical protein